MAKKSDKDDYMQHLRLVLLGIGAVGSIGFIIQFVFSVLTFGQIKLSEEVKSHLFAIRTTGGQEKVVMNLLETRAKMNKINIQSVLLVDNLKGYVVVEALDPNAAFQAIEGVRHIRGQLRGELEFKDIEGYLVKKSTVSALAVDSIVEITGGPFKGMKATVTRIDHEKEEATVVLLDASYQLPVTVDANYLKLAPEAQEGLNFQLKA